MFIVKFLVSNPNYSKPWDFITRTSNVWLNLKMNPLISSINGTMSNVAALMRTAKNALIFAGNVKLYKTMYTGSCKEFIKDHI